ncbi:MAG: HAMP domain-containing histidine kinase [Candidatus Marinimicrobia bacterium]|nr:HAMP domain-containing histidine kinase [Candidatus Neomarinimicrobiota bacterium]
MFKYSFQIKLGLFIFGFMIVFTVFGLNWYMVKNIREDAREQVEYLARAYTDAINNLEPENIQYILEIIMPSINFPMVITSNNEIYAVKNLNINYPEGSPEYEAKIRDIIVRMDESFTPLPVTGNDIEISRIHYGDPAIVGKLRWVPYLEVGLMILYILLGFFGFQFIRNSEKRSIWMGMARETAHQLGTPISSLMGWVKLLEDGESRKEVIPYIHEDISHLSQISNRFQKIGSHSKFKPVPLLKLAQKTADYMQARIPSSSRIQIVVSGEDATISGEETLLSWALENLVKNALDALKNNTGTITVEISQAIGASIQVTDTGSGISRKNRNHIFKPGFSTKKRGWGLGLSLTRRIIEDIHRGKITLVSSKPGGTVFRIDLPK